LCSCATHAHDGPTKRKSRGRIRDTSVVTCVKRLYLLLVLLVLALAACGSATQATTSTPTPTAQPTQAPTEAPTQASKPQIGNQDVVGGIDSSFIAKYGNPTSRTTSNGSPVLMFNAHDNNIGQFGVVLAPGTHTVYGLVISPPGAQSWDAITANTICINYVPEDSKLDPPKNVTDSSGNTVGLYQGGHSAELANSLNPDLFLDANNNPTTPGTFSIKYTYSDSSGTQANVCSIRLGEQSTSA